MNKQHKVAKDLIIQYVGDDSVQVIIDGKDYCATIVEAKRLSRAVHAIEQEIFKERLGKLSSATRRCQIGEAS